MSLSTTAPNTAVLVSLNFGAPDYAESLEELRLLAESAGVTTLALIEGKRQRPDASTFAGSGKVDEIAAVVEELEVPLVIFNHDLSPAQMRNLTAKLQTRVIDRTMLILDIFALRAQSHEGKVQVELAQLKYLSTRLVGMNTDMGQQKYAVGARGPGETQLELDRRKLDRRVHLLNERLKQLKRNRELQRKARNRSEVLSVSIVGYTNAGKSTLFNRLTNPKIRQAACIALGQIRDYQTLDLLMQRLSDEEAIVRAAAKEGVSEFDFKLVKKPPVKVISVGPGEKENGLLVFFRKDLDSKDSGLRVSSFVGLAKLQDVTILPLLLKEVVRPGNTTFVKKGAARALRILKPYVVEFFDGVANSSVISSVNLELNYKVDGQNLLSLIINALEDGANPLHADSVFILGELKDNASRPALRQALSQEDSDIVANAAYVLGLFEDKEAVPYLINVCNRYGL